jgi:CheY-like chemotaxis protein
MTRWILIVDDDDDVRETLADLLRGEGYSVRAAAGGAAATQILRTSQPCLVVSDLLMRDLDGRALQQWTRSFLAEAPPFVFVTGAVCVGSRPTSTSPSCRSPIDVDDLLRVIAEYCAGPPRGSA